MIRERGVRLGPLALLLAVIAIALATLAILSFTSARADMIMAQRFAQTVRIRYELDGQAQVYRNENNGEYTFESQIDDYMIEMSNNGDTVEDYHIYKIWQNDEGIHDLWEGN